MTRLIGAGVRALTFGLIAMFGLAVALGRMYPSQPRRAVLTPVRLVGISGYLISPIQGGPKLLDGATGRICSIELPADDRLEQPSVAPNTDDEGRVQVAGRWARRSAWFEPSQREQFGLARYDLASGRVLNRDPIDVVPTAPPCWMPGPWPRVLFPAGDGRIYRYEFAEPESSNVASRPTAVRWQVEPPGRRILVHGLIWPHEPELDGRAIASISYRPDDDGPPRYGPAELWWLELDAEGTAIVAAGRLTRADDPAVAAVVESHPAIGRARDGSLFLAYLAQQTRTSPWTLEVAPIEVRDGEPPVVVRSRSRVVAEGCVPAQPAPSPDGRLLHCLVQESGRVTVRRFALDDRGMPTPPPPRFAAIAPLPTL